MEAGCRCGKRLVIRTSWTTLNPGRTFWSCEDVSCNRSFQWAENQICEKGRRIISSLLNTKSRLEIELKNSKKREKRLWVVLILLVIIIIFKSRVEASPLDPSSLARSVVVRPETQFNH